MNKIALPIDPFLEQIKSAVLSQSCVILTAAPGSGKTTRIPPVFFSEIQKKILVLEPRRISAVSSATRIAEEESWTVGEEIGYQVRFENKFSSKTKIIFLTEALLLKKLIQDPSLSDVGLIILDEFHERSQHTDLALGLIKELIELDRPDLKLIVMSATIQAESISKFLNNAPILTIPGQTFPLQIIRQKDSQLLNTQFQFIDKVGNKIIEVLQNKFELPDSTVSPTGHILVFLPGVGEIDKVFSKLTELLEKNNRASTTTIPSNIESVKKTDLRGDSNKDKPIQIFKLFGQQSLNDQKNVLKSNPEIRKVILATNVAESSITIDGVQIVIDTGLARINYFHSNSQTEELKLMRTSKASQIQRSGRAARQAPGIAFQMWNELDIKSMKDYEEPEILRCNLNNTILSLSKLGITDFNSFSWFQKPPADKIQLTVDQLKDWNLLDKNNFITEIGILVLSLPLDTDLAVFSLYLMSCQISNLMIAELISVINEKDILRSSPFTENHLKIHGWESDWLARWEELSNIKKNNYKNTYTQNFMIDKSIQQIKTILDQIKKSTDWLKIQNHLQAAFSDKKGSLNSASESSLNLTAESNSNKSNSNLTVESSLNDSSLKSIELALLSVYGKSWLCRRRSLKDNKAVTIKGRGVELLNNSLVKDSDFFIALKRMEGLSQSDTKAQWAHGISVSTIKEFAKTQIKKIIKIEFNKEDKIFWAQEYMAWDKLPLEEPRKRQATAAEVSDHLPEIFQTEWDYVLKSNTSFYFWWTRYVYFCEKENIPLADLQKKNEIIQQICLGENRLDDVCQKDLVYFFQQLLTTQQKSDLEKKYPLKLNIFYIPKNTFKNYDKFKYIHYQGEQAPYVELKIQEAFGLNTNLKINDTNLTYILLGPNYRPVQVTKDIAGFWKGSYLEIRKELKARYPKHDWPENPT